MATISKKTLVIAGSVVVFGVCTGVIGYAVGHKDTFPTKSSNLSSSDTSASALERATKPPKGAVSPTAISKNISDYVDKEVTVYGLVTRVNAATYLIVGQEAKNPGGLPADFSKANIDPDKYANIPPAATSTTPPTLKPAVTITGTMKRTDKSITLVVSSVKE